MMAYKVIVICITLLRTRLSVRRPLIGRTFSLKPVFYIPYLIVMLEYYYTGKRTNSDEQMR